MHGNSTIRTIIAGLFACLAISCLPPPAGADYAEFIIGPSGQVTGRINGRAVQLPVSFSIVMYDQPNEAEGVTDFVMYSQRAAPNSYSDIWCGGRMFTADYHRFSGLVGWFSSATYPNGGIEPLVTDEVLDGYPMANLTGEPVRVDPVAAGTRVRIGRMPDPVLGDIFDFLDAYFAGETAADMNGDGFVTVQDIFDFLEIWLGG